MQSLRRISGPRTIAAFTIAITLAVGLALSSTAQSAKAKKRGYVTSALTLPATNAQAAALGRDLDGDGERDNQLGNAFAALAVQELDLQAPLSAAIASGDLLILHSLKAESFSNSKKATWQIFSGAPTAKPDFSGGGTFTVAAFEQKLKAKIKQGKVKAAGLIPQRLDLGAGDFYLDLTKGKLFATCSKNGCSDGRVTGAITDDQIENEFIPELAQVFTLIIQQDCPGPDPASCASDSQGKSLQESFDTNDDLQITAAELLDKPLIQTLFSPDLDLVKANGNPGKDGVADAMSFGLGFETVKAKLQGP